MIAFLLGCPGEGSDSAPKDTADTADTADAYTRPLGSFDLADARLVVRGEAAGDQLGSAVTQGDLDGDGVSEFLVSAPGGGSGGTVYLYSGGTTGVHVATDADVRFGGSVASALGTGLAVVGDIDGNGLPEVVLGAPGYGDAAGRVYVFEGRFDDRPPLMTAAATVDGEAVGDQFGVEVQDLGDLDGDGHAEIGVGAWFSDGNGVDSGRVYVFGDVDGAVLASAARFAVDGEAPSDWFGYSFVGGHDVDGDSIVDLLVGADGVDLGADSLEGAAYLYAGPLPTVSPTRVVGDGPGAFAGHAVVTLPGFAAVGAFGTGPSRRGAVGIFAGGMASGALADAAVVIPGLTDSGLFGYALASPGDIDGDGLADLVASARDDGTVAAETGATWVIYAPFSATPDLASNAAVLLGEAEGAASGYTLSGGGDGSGDGHPDVVVGAWKAGERDEGAAYLWDGG